MTFHEAAIKVLNDANEPLTIWGVTARAAARSDFEELVLGLLQMNVEVLVV